MSNIYQFQLEPNTNYGYLVHIGKMEKSSDILISKFNLKNDNFCNVVSCLYSENDIKECNNSFNLVKASHYIKNTELPTDIVFCKFIIKDNIDNIFENITENTYNKIKLFGNFSISHTDKYNSEQQLYETYCNPSNDKMIIQCVEKLAEII